MDSSRTPEYTRDDMRAQELSRQFEGEILQCVRQAYAGDIGSLRVLHSEAFRGTDRENLFCFKVLDSGKNRLYGVTAELQPDGSLSNYKQGIISS